MQKLYRLALIPSASSANAGLPLMRGYIGHITPVSEGRVAINGWAVLPETPMDEYAVWYKGHEVSRHAPEIRPEIATFVPWIPHGAKSGLNFELDIGEIGPAGAEMLEIVALQKGRPIGLLTQLVRPDVDRFPSPPEDYMYRVVHTRSLHFFKMGALKTFGDFVGLMNKNSVDWSCINRVLDWGCGCGRLSFQFLSTDSAIELDGSDIDASTIDWCKSNVGAGRYAVLNPMPPAPYDDAVFDFVFSYSVFTHLTRDAQDAWLKEMHRVLKPGGYFLATTHGSFALQFGLAKLKPTWPDDGFWDATLDHTLDGIAPAAYYRATYQSEAFTRKSFGRYFEIVDYLPRGATAVQDLVLMRKL